jgi:1-phosphofructokinase family hexose kinase
LTHRGDVPPLAVRIVVACPNLSLDRTVEVERVAPGHVHRATRVDVRGGGKGVNVARALKAMGVSASVVGLRAGHTGAAVVGLLEEEGIQTLAVAAEGETRSCLSIVSGTDVTVFNEPGPHIDAPAWAEFEDRVADRIGVGAIFVCSGSFPPGAPPDGAGRLLRRARVNGATTMCDTSTQQLANALSCDPDLVAPNLAEAEWLLHGRETESVTEGPGALERARAAADELAGRGPGAVLVTAGAAGAVLAHAQGTTTLQAYEVSVRNPVGAGDCLVAGIARGLSRGDDLVAAARTGAAMAAASCETFAAGELDPQRVESLLAT